MKESKVYGLNAAIAFAKSRPDKIQRAYYTKENIKHFQFLQARLAKAKKVYRVVDGKDLEKISLSKHHEGVCLIVSAPEVQTLETWLKSESKNKKSFILVLEKVGNPHNLGAITRIAAHFGCVAIASDDPKSLSSGAALRTAEGGAEAIRFLGYKSLDKCLQGLKKSGYTVLSTSSHTGSSVYSYKFPDKVALLFGEEGPGLSTKAFSLEDERLQIPGTGNVESLNVSTAIAIILGELWRQKNM